MRDGEIFYIQVEFDQLRDFLLAVWNKGGGVEEAVTKRFLKYGLVVVRRRVVFFLSPECCFSASPCGDRTYDGSDAHGSRPKLEVSLVGASVSDRVVQKKARFERSWECGRGGEEDGSNTSGRLSVRPPVRRGPSRARLQLRGRFVRCIRVT